VTPYKSNPPAAEFGRIVMHGLDSLIERVGVIVDRAKRPHVAEEQPVRKSA
jgi:hypothetical protein